MTIIKKLSDLKQTPHYYRKKPVLVRAIQITEEIEIQTREGTLKGYPGDFIIEGIQKEIYPCGKKIFEETYQRAGD